MSSHEIITLQFGSFANYVGGHYWNIQSRMTCWGLPSATRARRWLLMSTPTPFSELERTHKYFCLNAAGEIASEATADASTWDGPVQIQQSDRIPVSAFAEQLQYEQELPERAPLQELYPNTAAQEEEERAEALSQAARSLDSAAGVGYWTDYLKTFLHPRSLYQLPGVWQGAGRFRAFGEGKGHASSEALEDIMDRIRYWAEECNSFQGFQCFVDDHSGFGQMAADVVAELKVDYPNAPVMLYPVRPTQQAPPHATAARSHIALPPDCNTSINVTLPGGNVPRLDIAIHCYGQASMHDLAHLLGGAAGNSLACVSAALPCPSLPEERQVAEAQDHRTRHRDTSPSSASNGLWTQSSTACWSPGMQGSSRSALAESIVLRGPRRGGVALQAQQAADLLDQSLMLEGHRCVQGRCVLPQALPIPLPFPRIFKPSVLRYGDLAIEDQHMHGVVNGSSVHSNGTSHAPAEVHAVPVLTRLAATTAAQDLAQDHLRSFGGLARQMLHRWGYDADEQAEVAEQLHQYATGPDSDDEDSD